MKKVRLPVILLLPALVGVLMTTQVSYAACSNEKVKVSINAHGIWMKPDGGPKCLNVADPSDVYVSFPIELKTPGKYALRDGQVHVRQAMIKEVNGVDIGCSHNLEFEESEYTNTGENDIVVTVVGEDVSLGEFICYDVVVDDIGMLDPRAEVDDQNAFFVNVGREIDALIEAYNLLVSSGLGDPLTSVSLEDFIQANYEVTEEQVHELIEKHRK